MQKAAQKRTFMAKPGQQKANWYVIDAKGQVLGRMATKIAKVLRGKHKPTFTPHIDGGDHVVVINAKEVKLTGRKLTDKKYHYHTGYIGSLVTRSADEMRENNPEKLLELAVKRMIPSNHQGRRAMKKLKVYGGAEHPHSAQNPKNLDEIKA
jgi:large subunit ribosomal protein L13